MASKNVGLWLVGARGSVATTSIVGLVALQKNLINRVGLVSELPQFTHLPLPSWSQVVIGGHDIRRTPLGETAESLARQDQAISSDVLVQVKRDLARIEKNIRPGTAINVGPEIEQLADGRMLRRQETPRKAIERIQADLKAFATRHKLSQVIVINVASTEPPVDEKSLPRKWAALEPQLERPDVCPLGASSLYAIAALDLGYAYINFTPSLGSKPKAIAELAELRQTCHMGHDGKTGETLLKSVLAPMFAQRHLEVMSWVGHNIFGNLDGRVLDNPENKRTKVVSKDRLLGEIFGYQPQTHVSIEYIESLGDWKTAWDHIHFRGFLGTPMKMQFTWQGCDSILAAPLVLDLGRFAALARANGETGLLPFLACFFKSPLGVRINDFGRQFQMLIDWSRKQV